MTMPAWDTLTQEQQRLEWERYHSAQRVAVAMPAATRVARRRPVWPWLLGALAAVVLVVGAVTIGLSASTSTVSGDLTVTGSTTASISAAGRSCFTFGGYREIGTGTSVTVRNADNAIVAMGSLGAGVSDGASCRFPFTVTGVPRSEYYTIEVARRGPLTYSADQIRAGDVHQVLSSSLY